MRVALTKDLQAKFQNQSTSLEGVIVSSEKAKARKLNLCYANYLIAMEDEKKHEANTE